jgi:crotonobetaine/carnitine-CoA ligase
MSNRVEYPIAWWSHGWYGGVAALVHPDYRGKPLTHALALARPRCVIVEDAIVGSAAEEIAACGSVEHVVVVGDGEIETWAGPRFHRWEDLEGLPEDLTGSISPSAAATIMYTSGTSGGSKAVLRSHHYDFVYAAMNADGHRHDESVHLFSPSTACHVRTGTCVLYAALLALGQATITQGFSARRFWAEQVASGATHAYLSGTTVNILMKATPSPAERAHRLRTIQSLPAPLDPPSVEARFNVHLSSQGYGSTEAYPSPPEILDQDWSRARNCIGRAHPLMEVIVADADRRPVPPDGSTKGEILVRPRLPDTIMSEYYGDPQATAAAFHDRWFHTGDLATWDRDGYLYFAGRATDTIRRRGENISAQEVEQAALEHQAVHEAAAYGRPSELGEEDVKLDAIVDASAELTEAELVSFLAERLPRWAVPRYVEFVTDFPRTDTFKVLKASLRSAPLGPRVYDREGVGL